MVRAFYTTLAYDAATETVSAELKGIAIRLTLAEFGELAQLPSIGDKLIQLTPPASWENFHFETACLALFHARAEIGKRPILASSLTTQTRLLHYALARILLPKHSNYAQVSGDEVVVLWGLKRGEKMNWAHLVVTHMLKCRNSAARPLLYGVLITKILRHFKVPVGGEQVLKGEEAYHTFGSATLNQMHVVLYDGLWCYGPLGTISCVQYNPSAPRPPATEPVPAPSSSRSAPPDSSATLDQYRALLDEFRAQQQGMFDSLRQEILLSREMHSQEILLSREIHSREMAALDSRMTALEVRYASLEGTSTAAPDSDQPMEQQVKDAGEP